MGHHHHPVAEEWQASGAERSHRRLGAGDEKAHRVGDGERGVARSRGCQSSQAGRGRGGRRRGRWSSRASWRRPTRRRPQDGGVESFAAIQGVALGGECDDLGDGTAEAAAALHLVGVNRGADMSSFGIGGLLSGCGAAAEAGGDGAAGGDAAPPGRRRGRRRRRRRRNSRLGRRRRHRWCRQRRRRAPGATAAEAGGERIRRRGDRA